MLVSFSQNLDANVCLKIWKGASVNSVYLVQNGAVLSKTLTAKVTDSKVDSLNGVSQGAKVDGDVSLTFDGISAVKDGSSASVYGASSATILGNLDLKLKSQSGSEMSVYAPIIQI